VTGAAGSIGAEIAREVAAAGACVALLDREGERAQLVAEEITQTGSRAMGVQCDVTSRDSIVDAAKIVSDHFGLCSILINNAAALNPGRLIDLPLDKWNELLAINLTGYLLCSQIFGQQMIARSEGTIIHISSLSGHLPQPYSGAYSVSKAGVKMLSQLLAVELGEHRIRSNVVSPGMIRTPMSEMIYENPEVLRLREEIVPAHRISQPIDIAEIVLYLASNRSSYINGQDIVVDGGLSQMLLGLIPRPGFEREKS
jgi:NAD(P)-dependent dehydrogenase (short-subunit alcohol dehydrogenase family)